MKTISQRELCEDNSRILSSVEAGESFVVTREGVPVAVIAPYQESAAERSEKTTTQAQDIFSHLPPADGKRWSSGKDSDAEAFDSNNPFGKKP